MEELHFEHVQKCLVDDVGNTLTLVRLIVMEEHRRKGVGTRVLQYIKQRARKRRQWVRLTVDPSVGDVERADLVRFYKRSGFRLCSDNETMIWSP